MSKPGRNIDILSSIGIGDPITAEYLNAITRVLNTATRAVSGPRQPLAPVPGSASGSPGLSDLDFTESSRTETTSTFTDDNGDQVDINIIDSVTFVNSEGDILTLTFDNP